MLLKTITPPGPKGHVLDPPGQLLVIHVGRPAERLLAHLWKTRDKTNTNAQMLGSTEPMEKMEARMGIRGCFSRVSHWLW